jgi:hypothetical protein
MAEAMSTEWWNKCVPDVQQLAYERTALARSIMRGKPWQEWPLLVTHQHQNFISTPYLDHVSTFVVVVQSFTAYQTVIRTGSTIDESS